MITWRPPLKQPFTGEGKLTLSSLRSELTVSWQSLFPRDSHLHLSFFMLLSTLSSVFLTSTPDSFLMQRRIELLQRRGTDCFPPSRHSQRLRSAMRGGNFSTWRCVLSDRPNKQTMRSVYLLQACAPNYERGILQD